MNHYNIYDLPACERAVKALKAFSITCSVKAQHYSKLWELKDLVNTFCLPLNPIYFGEYNSEIYDYHYYVTELYTETKKLELDNKLRRTIYNLIKQVESCILTEYQTRDGRLIPHPTRRGSWIEPKR